MSRKNQLSNSILAINIRQIKEYLPSFKTINLPTNNWDDAIAFYAVLQKDINTLEKMTKNQAVKIVLAELMERDKILRNACANIEHKRITQKLVSTDYIADPNDIASLYEASARIEQDQLYLTGEPKNSVTQELQKELLNRKKLLQKQIRSYQKKNKEQGFKSKTSYPQNEENGTILSDTIVKNTPVDSSPGKGCLFALMLLCVTFVLSLVPVVAFSSTSTANLNLQSGGFFIIQTIGFSITSYFFLRRATPSLYIRGFKRQTGIYIIAQKTGGWINNIKLIKALVGLITCIIIYFAVLSLVLFTNNEDAAAIILFFGIILGPVAAIIVSKRTSFFQD